MALDYKLITLSEVATFSEFLHFTNWSKIFLTQQQAKMCTLSREIIWTGQRIILLLIFGLANIQKASPSCEFISQSKQCNCSYANDEEIQDFFSQQSECSYIILEDCNLITVPEWVPGIVVSTFARPVHYILR